jgi:hypothetical protein
MYSWRYAQCGKPLKEGRWRRRYTGFSVLSVKTTTALSINQIDKFDVTIAFVYISHAEHLAATSLWGSG